VLNLGGGSRISVSGALDVLASVMGRDIDVRPAAKQAGDVTDTCASIERAGDLIGYAPKVDLAAGLAAEYRWLAESLEAPAV
jgi:UDP-glucose 4-epimerase